MPQLFLTSDKIDSIRLVQICGDIKEHKIIRSIKDRFQTSLTILFAQKFEREILMEVKENRGIQSKYVLTPLIGIMEWWMLNCELQPKARTEWKFLAKNI